MTEPPTPSELDRRLGRLESQLTDGLAQLNKRLDSFPTEQTIIALFQVRDTQITAQAKAIAELTKELDQERRDRERADAQEKQEREAADKRVEDRVDSTRRANTVTVISGSAALAAVLGLLITLMRAVQ